jgi:glyoxylase-like metal-dependent hydrolase (beta-lactamase superfamily II)
MSAVLPNSMRAVQDGLLPAGRHVRRIRLLLVPHHHDDLAAQVLLVEAEGLFAAPVVVEVDVEFHRGLLRCLRKDDISLRTGDHVDLHEPVWRNQTRDERSNGRRAIRNGVHAI